MPDLRHTRRKLSIVLAVLAGVDLLAVLLYFSPLIGSTESRQQQLNRLQVELALKTRSSVPLENLPQKVRLANQQIAEFYKKRFPSHNSEILMELGRLAAENGVRIEHARYKAQDDKDSSRDKEPTIAGVDPVEMEADMSGSYTGLAKFINAIERDPVFFIIKSVGLGGSPQGQVKLSVTMETYLKEAS